MSANSFLIYKHAAKQTRCIPTPHSLPKHPAPPQKRRQRERRAGPTARKGRNPLSVVSALRREAAEGGLGGRVPLAEDLDAPDADGLAVVDPLNPGHFLRGAIVIAVGKDTRERPRCPRPVHFAQLGTRACHRPPGE